VHDEAQEGNKAKLWEALGCVELSRSELRLLSQKVREIKPRESRENLQFLKTQRKEIEEMVRN
jgi:hypothetical protein